MSLTKTTVPVRERRQLVIVWSATVLMIGVAVLSSVTRQPSNRFMWREVRLHDIRHEIGFAFAATTGRPELSGHEHPSDAVVLEDGRPLGPGNAPHESIRTVGRGQFSLWHD